MIDDVEFIDAEKVYGCVRRPSVKPYIEVTDSYHDVRKVYIEGDRYRHVQLLIVRLYDLLGNIERISLVLPDGEAHRLGIYSFSQIENELVILCINPLVKR